ncbi:MAG: hypothetical protein HOL13_10035 [Phycisphaerae bacterium]|nr:hypothetical protein [Phycisphaerae bacterium]
MTHVLLTGLYLRGPSPIGGYRVPGCDLRGVSSRMPLWGAAAGLAWMANVAKQPTDLIKA